MYAYTRRCGHSAALALRRYVPLADQVHCSKQRTYWVAFPTSTIRGTRIVNVEPRPGSLSTRDVAPHHAAKMPADGKAEAGAAVFPGCEAALRPGCAALCKSAAD